MSCKWLYSKQQTIASLGFTPSDISRFTTYNPNILQTLLQQITNEREKKNKTTLLLNQANDVRLANERWLLHHWLLWGQKQNVVVAKSSKIDAAARVDVLTLTKVQVWAAVSCAGSATHRTNCQHWLWKIFIKTHTETHTSTITAGQLLDLVSEREK